MKQRTKQLATVFAILAAALYAINVPLSKLLLAHVGATMMAAFLYLGAAQERQKPVPFIPLRHSLG